MMSQRPCEVPHHKHQPADKHQQQDTPHPHDMGQRQIDPLARRQFRRCGAEHQDEPDEEARAPENFPQHVAGRDAHGGAFGDGKALT